jgi:S-adenosylmethionine hydrolase
MDRTVASVCQEDRLWPMDQALVSQETATVSGTLSGKVVRIDDSGNLVTDILGSSLSGAPRDATLRVVVDEHETYGLFPVDHSQPAMTLVAIVDDTNPLTIVLVGDSASAMLGVRPGAPVEVHW